MRPATVVSANAGSDSSHGRAMVTPAPRSTVRREIRWADFGVRSDILFTFLFLGIQASFVQELRAGDDGFHQRSEAVTVRRQLALACARSAGSSESMQRPAQSVGQQFAAEIVEEILLAMLADVGLHALEAGALAAAGKDRLRIDRPSGQVVGRASRRSGP